MSALDDFPTMANRNAGPGSSPPREGAGPVPGIERSGVAARRSDRTLMAWPLQRRNLSESTLPYQPRFHVVLHQPEIPGNTGAVGRTCVALAAKLWLVRPLGFRVDESTRKRAGLDYWQHLVWAVVDNWQELRVNLPDQRFWYFSKTADRFHTAPRFQAGDVLVFGSETSGLPASFLETAGAAALRIPTTGLVRSLNLSCSVAVAGYEVDRQLRTALPGASEHK